jgi:hypothetical protein
MLIILHNLRDPIQGVPDLEFLPSNNVVSVAQKGERETADPVNQLLALTEITTVHRFSSCEQVVPLLPGWV